jgi:hypothetical protein
MNEGFTTWFQIRARFWRRAERISKRRNIPPVSWVNDGPPFSATFRTDGDPLGIDSTDPWVFPSYSNAPGCNSLVNPGNPSKYIKTQCFAIPTSQQRPRRLVYCINLRGTAGRNDAPGPGLMNLDFSLFKTNYFRKISESFNVQFRADIFNILNHPNFALPVSPDNTDIFDSTGAPLNSPDNGAAGVLKSTTTKSREIQFALKVIW